MASVDLNPITERIRGAIGDLVFKKFMGRVIIARKRKPDDRVPSPAELEVRERFKAAAGFARGIFADPVQKARYVDAAKAQGTLPFATAMSDFLYPPEVKAIDTTGYRGQVGDAILVTATDDFEVTSVTVTLRDAARVVIEQGPAIKTDGKWVYAATAVAPAGEPLTIEAEAKDRPGHAHVLTVPWSA